jgi:branched-chain amino acid aminotransferase
VTEAFGSGTAAVVTPVGKLGYKDEAVQVGGGGVGPLTRKLYDALTGIQTGKQEDRYGWIRIVDAG